MKSMKINLALLLVLVFSVSGQAAPFKMRLSHQLPETHFLAGEIRDFQKLVEERTDGKVVVEVYPAAQAFKEKEVIHAVATGSIEAGMAVNFAWARSIPTMVIFTMPFMLTELPMIDKAISGEVGANLFKKIESKGVTPLMWLFQTRSAIFTSNEKLLKRPSDFKGKKMRGGPKLLNVGFEALGATTTPISGPEVYMALQLGTIEIGVTGLDGALARHYYEVQKYGTATNAFSAAHVVFLNSKF